MRIIKRDGREAEMDFYLEAFYLEAVLCGKVLSFLHL